MSNVSISAPPTFLAVKCGDYVVIEENIYIHQEKKSNWWIGQVINKMGSARDPSINSFFQVIDIDTGSIKTINANLVQEILNNNF